MRTAGWLLVVSTLAIAILPRWQRSPAKLIVRITAKKFAYQPNHIELKKGVPATLELTSIDRDHGFNVPALGLRADIKPGMTTRVHIVPQRAGTFEFECDLFCGSGHEDMTGEIVVRD